MPFALDMPPESSRSWQIVADVEQSQADVVELRRQLDDPAAVAEAIAESIQSGSDRLARIMASADDNAYGSADQTDQAARDGSSQASVLGIHVPGFVHWPGRIEPMSLIPRSRFINDSARSPIGATTAAAMATRWIV